MIEPRVAARLESFTSLPLGWDSYGGIPARVDTVNLVKSLLSMDGFPQPRHVGTGSGNIHLDFTEDIEAEVREDSIAVLDSRGPDWLQWPETSYRLGDMVEYTRLKNDLAGLLAGVAQTESPFEGVL